MWTENWGQMVWGGAALVPLMQPMGLLVVAAALLLAARLSLRSRARPWLRVSTFVVLLAVPLVAVAAQISVPFTFVNGTIADADQVNANFDTVVNESNAQDTRITALESQLGLAECRWEIVPSSGIGSTATGTCPGGNVVTAGCRKNSGPGALIQSFPDANDGDPFGSINTWRCTYDAVSQFDIYLLCCGP